MPEPAAATFDCPVEGCDRSFTLERGLKRHLNATHGHELSAAALRQRIRRNGQPDLAGSELLARVQQHIAAIAAPLQAELDAITEQLAAVDKQRAELLEAQRQLNGALRKLEAAPAKKRTQNGYDKVNPNLPLHHELTDAVVSYLNEHADQLTDGFNTAQLKRWLHEEGHTLSTERAYVISEQLRERGLIRLDRIGKGGSRIWKLVAAAKEADTDV